MQEVQEVRWRCVKIWKELLKGGWPLCLTLALGVSLLPIYKDKPSLTVTMNPTVNNLGTIADIISMTSKALDIASRAISLLEAGSTAVEKAEPEELSQTPASEQPKASIPQQAPIPVKEQPKASIPQPSPVPATKQPMGDAPQQPNYRAEAIRFNEEFLNTHYDLRFNTLKRATEFRRRGDDSADAWQPMDERHRNRLTTEQLKAGGQSWGYGMQLCIESSSVRSYNPVADYLEHLPEWDRRRDYIGELARRVPTAFKQWPQLFHRWLLAMVAQVRGMSREHGNALVPMLIGGQGTGKTTFCRSLLPPGLRDYFMDDIKMDSAEQVERVLGRMWLVNIDEYDCKTQREQAKIKRLLTERQVQVRRPRSDQYTLVSRLCSFIATTNERQPLTDPTGSRRYICVELDGVIDTATPVPHDQVFAQALYELGHGEPFFLSREEERLLEEHNGQYRRRPLVETVVGTLVEPAPVGRDTLLTSTEILQALSALLPSRDMPTMQQLATVLRNLGVRQGAQQGRHGWYASLRGDRRL